MKFLNKFFNKEAKENKEMCCKNYKEDFSDWDSYEDYDEFEDDYNCGDIEFLVFANKGVVVCKIHNCEFLAINRITKYIEMNSPLILSVAYDYLIKNTFVGVAHCAPDDTWDEEFGKKLALTKAKAKRCKAINRAVKMFIEKTDRSLERLETYGIHEVPDPKQLIEE